MSSESLNRVLDEYNYSILTNAQLAAAKKDIDFILFTYLPDAKERINKHYSKSDRGRQDLRNYIVANTINNASPNLQFRGRRPEGGGKSKKRIGRKKSRKSKRRSMRSK
jgi:hypothetical protein